MTGLFGATSEVTLGQWLWVTLPLGVYFGIVFVLVGFGRYDQETNNPLRIFFGRISNALQRSTGYPGWAMAGALSGLFALALAAMGAYWDIAWHVDLGRDESLMTPSHTMILMGLGGLLYSAVIATLFANLDGVRKGLRIGRLWVPWSALGLYALGVGGVMAFPLDALWHNAYGIDVTLWSPSHLQLLASGSFATIAVWLMIAEGREGARPTPLGKLIVATTAGATLTGMSTFQAEFDFGVPAYQALYLPLLIAAAAAFTLVFARLSIGRWGALHAAVGFVVLRVLLAGMVGESLGHSVPRFPLYIPTALAIEAVAWRLGTDRVVRFAVVSGLLTAVAGLIVEPLWASVSGWYTPSGSAALLAKAVVLTPVVGVAAGVVGAGLALAFTGTRVRAALLAGAGVALVAAFAYPLPRDVGDVEAIVRLRPADVAGQSFVDVELIPADAADGATGFGVMSWQGGGRVGSELRPTGEPGRYRGVTAVPIGGEWKTVVGLQRGSQVMATAVALPADPEIDAPEVAPLPERRTRFVRNSVVTQRETHPGPLWPQVVGYAGITLATALWIGLFARTARRIAPGAPVSPGPGSSSTRTSRDPALALLSRTR